jgi:hypothetical protein
MWELSGTEIAFGLHSFIANAETKKKKLADHFEANKDTPKKAFESILVIFEKARQKFDF